MIGFIVGLFVGGFFGVVTMCILSVAGQSDHEHDDFQDDIEIVNKDWE